jgi:hypothetical protein
MAFSLKILEKPSWLEGSFAKICILKTILRMEGAQNGL